MAGIDGDSQFCMAKTVITRVSKGFDGVKWLKGGKEGGGVQRTRRDAYPSLAGSSLAVARGFANQSYSVWTEQPKSRNPRKSE